VVLIHPRTRKISLSVKSEVQLLSYGRRYVGSLSTRNVTKSCFDYRRDVFTFYRTFLDLFIDTDHGTLRLFDARRDVPCFLIQCILSFYLIGI